MNNKYNNPYRVIFERLFMKIKTIGTFVLILVFSLLFTACEQKPSNKKSEANMKSNFHSFTMTDIDGNAVSLSKYQGKVVLVVNVASKCGFTKQYAGLQKLCEKYKYRGFVMLGFPANNFLRQEPGTDAEIKNVCTIKFNVTFPMFSQITVKGVDIHQLYQYLTSPEVNGEFGKPIKWNFNKFLIGKDGKTIARFP